MYTLFLGFLSHLDHHRILKRVLYAIQQIQISYLFLSILYIVSIVFSLVQFSCSVVSGFLRPHEPQHARPPCPSPTPTVYPNSGPPSWWCHSAISSSVIPFSSRLQSFPASGSFRMSQLFTSSGQSIGVSASTSVPSLRFCQIRNTDIR